MADTSLFPPSTSHPCTDDAVQGRLFPMHWTQLWHLSIAWKGRNRYQGTAEPNPTCSVSCPCHEEILFVCPLPQLNLYVHYHSWIFQPADSLSACPNLHTPGHSFISPYQSTQHSSAPDNPCPSLTASQDPFVFFSLSSVAFYPSCFFFLLSFLTTHLEKGEFLGRRLMEKILPPYLSKQGSQELFTYFLISSENVLIVLWSPQGIGFVLFCIFCLSMLAQF